MLNTILHSFFKTCLSVDKPMQLNQALFMLGGGSGYVPQPDIMRDDMFDPFDKDTLHVEPITIQLQVRLNKQDRGSLIVQLSQS